MKQLIHKRFKVTIAFEKKEAEAFYDALLHYNNDTILDAGYSMFNRDETPLQNHWDDDVAFLTCYYLFRKMAKKMSKSDFVKTIVTLQQPSKILFDSDERLVLANKKNYLKQAKYLFSFLDSLSEYFDYEAILLSCGYPCDAYEPEKIKKVG